MAVLPITSCTCERSASSVRLLKTYLRSTMSQERLNGLVTIYTHNDMKINIDEVIEKFARKEQAQIKYVKYLGHGQKYQCQGRVSYIRDELEMSRGY